MSCNIFCNLLTTYVTSHGFNLVTCFCNLFGNKFVYSVDNGLTTNDEIRMHAQYDAKPDTYLAQIARALIVIPHTSSSSLTGLCFPTEQDANICIGSHTPLDNLHCRQRDSNPGPLD